MFFGAILNEEYVRTNTNRAYDRLIQVFTRAAIDYNRLYCNHFFTQIVAIQLSFVMNISLIFFYPSPNTIYRYIDETQLFLCLNVLFFFLSSSEKKTVVIQCLLCIKSLRTCRIHSFADVIIIWATSVEIYWNKFNCATLYQYERAHSLTFNNKKHTKIKVMTLFSESINHFFFVFSLKLKFQLFSSKCYKNV